MPHMRQFCVFTYPPRSKWNSPKKMIFFAKIDIFCKPIAGQITEACTQCMLFGFSMYACGFSVPQMRQYCLFTYAPRSKWLLFEKMIFFAKIGIFCKSIIGPLPSIVQAYIQSYSFGGRIKLIICRIRHELSVTIHEISTSWKKKKRYMANPIHIYIRTWIFIFFLFFFILERFSLSQIVFLFWKHTQNLTECII